MASSAHASWGWAVFVLLTWFLQLLGPLLGLPEFVQQLALTSHLGQPMVGIWDWGGMAATAVVAVGGVLIGAWGLGGATCAADARPFAG